MLDKQNNLCGYNNFNTAEDYLNIYMTSALYTQKLKMSKTNSRYRSEERRVGKECQ